MTVADQIRKLATEGKISRGAAQEFSRYAGDLENLGQAIRQGNRLTDGQQATFRTLYSNFIDYSRKNFTDRSPEQLRGMFFEGMLGHMIRNEDDAIKLRKAILKETAPVASNFAPAARQLGLTPETYNDLRGMAEDRARILGVEADWRRVRDAETTRDAQATARARDMQSRDKAAADAAVQAKNDAAARAERAAAQRQQQAEAQAAQAAGNRPSNITYVDANGQPQHFTVAQVERYGAITDPAEARKVFKDNAEFQNWTYVRNNAIAPDLQVNIRDTVANLQRALASDGRLPVAQTFDQLRDYLRDPAAHLVMQGTHALPTTSPREVLDRLARGQMVSEDELSRLQVAFRHFDDKKPAAVPQAAAPMTVPAIATGGKAMMMFGRDALMAARDVANNALREGTGRTKPSILREFETGEIPSRFGAFRSNNPIITGIGAVSTALGVSFAGLGLSGYVLPENRGQLSAFAFDAMYWPDGIKGEHDLTSYQARAMFAGEGMNDDFIKWTNRFAPSFKKVDNNTVLSPKELFEISIEVSKNAPGIYNPRDVRAYVLALAQKSMMSADSLNAESGAQKDTKQILDDLVQHNQKRLVDSTATAMLSDVRKRNEVFEQYYGKSNLSDSELISEFASRPQSTANGARANNDEILRLQVGEYLVRRKLITPEMMTDFNKLQTAGQEAAAQSLEATARANDLAIARGTVTAPQVAEQEATPRELPVREYVERVKSSFNRTAAAIPELNGKESVLLGAFNHALKRDTNKVDEAIFDAELKKGGISEEQRRILSVQVQELALR